MKRQVHNQKNGLTVIELMVVVAIIALLVAVITVPFISFRKNQALQNTTNAVSAVLEDARTKTLAAVNNTSYGVHIDSDKTVLFSGATYDASATTNEVYFFEDPITASFALQGGGSNVRFSRLTGATGDYGTIILTIPGGSSHSVTISATGTIVRN